MLTREPRTLARKRAVSLVCILLFLLIAVEIPAPAVMASSPIRVPQDYMRIQDAINAASPGDAIIVSSRIYSENLVIEKPINLTGVSAQTTIIDGSGAGAGITIANTSSVTVSGFTVRNTGFFDSGIVIYSSTKVAVTGNILSASNESNATYVYNSNTTTVKDNVLTASLNGISVQGGFGNLIREHTPQKRGRTRADSVIRQHHRQEPRGQQYVPRNLRRKLDQQSRHRKPCRVQQWTKLPRGDKTSEQSRKQVLPQQYSQQHSLLPNSQRTDLRNKRRGHRIQQLGQRHSVSVESGPPDRIRRR